MGFPAAYPDFTLPEPILHALSILDFILTRLGLSDFLQPDTVWQENPTRTASESALLFRRKCLPIVKFEELVGGGEPPENCAVCLHEFGGGEEIGWLKNCWHVFHKACLDRWMDHDQNTCPLCRAPLF
ncbi:brassinosteroid-responsive RING-H2 [Hibiscus trionum]|uniref:Brassinosteroid-responsive RING-H2 n=1 Tax=Hibiscus trionum TaxID=183268 RepID=A0A9W7HAP0_HIBTR|nr:brassinosteroid-responsive RING-H2 [Hibiscus trionum]